MANRLSEDPRQVIDTAFAEKGVLGAVLIEPKLLEHCRSLRTEDFHYPFHQRIFEAILSLDRAGADVSPLMVSVYLKENSFDPFFDLRDHACINSIEYMVTLVRQFARRRKAQGKLENAMSTLGKWDDDLLSEFKTMTDDAIALLMPEHRIENAADGVVDILSDLDEPAKVIRSGIQGLDNTVGGFLPARFWIIAGRTSMGKSALAQCISLSAAKSGHAILYGSIEGSTKETKLRMITIEAGVSPKVLEEKRVDMFQAKLVTEAAARFSKLPIYFFDGQTQWDKIEAEIITAKHQHQEIKVVFIDHLSDIESPPYLKRWEAVGKLVTSMRRLALEYEMTIVLLCQINREPEKKKNNRPTLADLRESGSLEQEADVALLLYRPGFYSKDPDDLSAEILVAKQRNGPTGKVALEFDPVTMRWRDCG